MKIVNHFLVDDPRIQPYSPAPRGWANVDIKPEFLLWHYTATETLYDAWLSQYFAHIYIDGDKIYQRVPLNKMAYHAGVSEWGGRYDLNKYSHGIETIYFGFLYKDWQGRYYRDGKYFDASLVVDKPHPLEASKRYWLKYLDKTLQTALDVSCCLHEHYHYIDAVGHEDVAAKVDPGPMFPKIAFQKELFGSESNARYGISRWWPGNDVGAGGVSLKYAPYSWSPSKIWCDVGTVVRKMTWEGRWVKVERQDGKDGWILEKYLRRILGEVYCCEDFQYWNDNMAIVEDQHKYYIHGYDGASIRINNCPWCGSGL